MSRHARPGRIKWIGLRPARRKPLRTVGEAELTQRGLTGDHAPGGQRALTLIQAEHLPAIAALCGLDDVDPAALRRNLVVSGLNLAGRKGVRLRLGSAEIVLTGPCHPCSRMEENLGHGGYAAMRGHGGWYAEVARAGRIAVGDEIVPV